MAGAPVPELFANSSWKFPTNNARSEEMAAKASFRDGVKSRRCIIPADAICEWTGPQGSKTRHMITRADGAPLFLAGLWALHRWEGEETVSYTMVMQETAPATTCTRSTTASPWSWTAKARRCGWTAGQSTRA